MRVWKFKEVKTCEDYRCRVAGKVEEAKWKGLGANDHWQQMKGIMMETAQDICGMTKGPPRHKETWWMEYKKSRQNAKRVISSAKEKKQKEWANDLNDSEGQSRWLKKDRI